MTIRTVVKQATVIVIVSVVICFLWNAFSPNRIAWVRRQVPKVEPVRNNAPVHPDNGNEAKACDVVDTTQALEFFNEGTATFIDARLREDYEKGHIIGAISIPTEQFDIIYPEVSHLLNAEKALIVYCEGIGCELSEEICQFLLDMDYEDVHLYEAGWPEWKEKGLPQSSVEESED